MRHQPILYKARQVIDFSTDALVSNWLFAVNYNGSPTKATTSESVLVWNYPGTGLQATSVLSATSIATIWDSCRLAGVKVQYTPAQPNDTYANIRYFPGYLVWDVDGHEFDLATMPSENGIVQTSRCRVVNLCMPWKAYYKAPKRRVTSLQPTVYQLAAIATLPNVNVAGLWHDPVTAVAPTNQKRGSQLFFGAYNLTANGTRYGRFLFTFYYVFKDRIDN